MTMWISFINAIASRFFSVEPLNTNASLVELENKVRLSCRLHRDDLETDSPPRIFDSQDHARHAVELEISIKEQQVDAFALELSNYLKEMRNAK